MEQERYELVQQLKEKVRKEITQHHESIRFDMQHFDFTKKDYNRDQWFYLVYTEHVLLALENFVERDTFCMEISYMDDTCTEYTVQESSIKRWLHEDFDFARHIMSAAYSDDMTEIFTDEYLEYQLESMFERVIGDK